jgi:hypothetical protein
MMAACKEGIQAAETELVCWTADWTLSFGVVCEARVVAVP